MGLSTFLTLFLILYPISCSFAQSDTDLLEFTLNLEFLQAEFFLGGWFGLWAGCCRSIPDSGRSTTYWCYSGQFGSLHEGYHHPVCFPEVGHIRAIRKAVPGFPRPLLDLSVASFAKGIDQAFRRPLQPPFSPYANTLNYLIPYVSLNAYVGAIPRLNLPTSKRLVAGLLSVKSAQDAIIQVLLYERATVIVQPYGIPVSEFTNRISDLRNRLGLMGLKDEGLIVLPLLGTEGRVSGNVVSANVNSIAYDRTPEEILRIVYGSGNERVPCGFYPKECNGRIAESYLG